MNLSRALFALAGGALLAACGADDSAPGVAVDPEAAPVASVDRFQDSFATLFKRSAPAFDPANVSKVVPAADEPIDFDNFLVKSFGPAGERVTYYSFDIVGDVPQRAYELVRSDGAPVEGQLPILTKLPGDEGYTDYARITTVAVDDAYIANSATSADDVASLVADGAAETETTRVVNWSVVPIGSTASLRFLGKPATGYRGWVNGEIAHLMQFETDLAATPDGKVPAVPIVVIFKDGMSPAMGFAAEPDGQTHNVVASLPGQKGYSSYWDHSVGSLDGFDQVRDLETALANDAQKVPVIVNCPVVAP